MTIIKIEKEKDGWHQNISGSVSNIPDGWALLPESLQIPKTFPFVNIEVSDIDGVQTVTSISESTVPKPEPEPEPESPYVTWEELAKAYTEGVQSIG